MRRSLFLVPFFWLTAVAAEPIEHLADSLNYIDVAALISAADVVRLSETAAVYDGVEGTRVILDVKPITDVFAFTVNGKGFCGKAVQNHYGN